MTEPRRSIAPVVFGLVLTGAFLVAIGYAASQRRKAEAITAPQVMVLSPADGDVVPAPITVRFTSSRPLTPAVGGWGDGRYHIHAVINGREYMPAAADIEGTPDGSYIWRIAADAKGAATLSLVWADRAHRRLPDPTPTISLQVR
jgi:hypothetical protein